ncbi:DUF6297 family protein [Sphaerimonospora thailandensis]|uniref:Uncharacterized protein n=1 Tax=Sphaerimonospora thailandensis TaxID=795644 RepID=A0A8J3R631_9ACTN|nr:DUF6297 family protein [Sphaerimonospora thailandensis]GIH69787.1 hypothetical protein Mth01_20400 [Sphaerimonospora thailandensis]
MTTIAQMTRRRGRDRESGWQRAYYRLVAAGLTAAIGGPQIARLTSWLFDGSGIGSHPLGLALLLAAFAGVMMLVSWAGPIVVSPADVRWLVLSPLNRRRTLARSALILLTLLTAAGATIGVLGAAVFGRPGELLFGVLLGSAAMAAAGSAAVLLQEAEAKLDWIRLAAISLVAVAGALIWLRPELPGLSTAQVAGAALIAAGLLMRLAWRALASFPARVLVNASARMVTAAAASLGLEPALLASVAEERYWRHRRLRSRRWPRDGRWLIVRSDLRMLSRRPGRLTVLAGLTALPTIVCLAGGTLSIAVAVLLAGGLSAATTAAAGARWEAQNPEIPRMLAMRGLSARAVVPAALVALWVGTAFAILSLAGFTPIWCILYGLAAAPGLTAGALRMARRGPVNHAMPVIDLGLGGIPTGPLFWAIAGVDIAALGNAPLLFGMTPLSLAVQAILGAALLAAYLNHNR